MFVCFFVFLFREQSIMMPLAGVCRTETLTATDLHRLTLHTDLSRLLRLLPSQPQNILKTIRICNYGPVRVASVWNQTWIDTNMLFLDHARLYMWHYSFGNLSSLRYLWWPYGPFLDFYQPYFILFLYNYSIY